MSLTSVAGGRTAIALTLVAVAVLLLAAGALDASFAQGSPFGGPRGAPPPPPPADGLFGWIFAKQAEASVTGFRLHDTGTQQLAIGNRLHLMR